MNTELIDYYKNLLIMQYRDKPKALGHVGAVLDAGMIYDVAIAVRDGFNIETAIGAQLDVLGRILGVSRTITGTTFTRAYYGYALYGDTSPFLFNPMLLYGAEPPDVQFRDYRESSQSLYDLTDEEYRIILKLAIVRNTSNASVKTIDEILNVLFGAECYFIDRMNMTVVSYMVGTKWSRIFSIAKSSGLLPNPAGVGTSLVVVPDINNIFAYSLYGGAKPDFAKGYTKYIEWATFGNAFSSYAKPVLTAKLSDTEFVVWSGKIQAWNYTGTEWVKKGNALYTGNNNSNIVALSETRIVLITGVGVVQAYDFDGEDWAPVGNTITVSDRFTPATALSPSRIIIANLFTEFIQAYDFDGTNWAPVGNDLYVGNILPTSLSSSRIVAVKWVFPCSIQAYDFDGTDWATFGDPLSITAGSINSVTSVSSSKIILQVNEPDKLQPYELIDGDWEETDNAILTEDSFYAPYITGLSETSFIRSFSGGIQEYVFARDLTGCMATYS